MQTKPNETVSFPENENKFRELVLLLATESQRDPRFGSVKLNKLLFAVDLLAYGSTGRPITGFEYVKRRLGPAPKRFVAMRDKMIGDRELALQIVTVAGFEQKRPVALRPPNLASFTAEEIRLVYGVLASFRGVNATEISEWSHGLCGWAIAEDNAKIPYEAVFLSDSPLTAYEAERGRQLALERGWDVF
jgi:hypothetical protein